MLLNRVVGGVAFGGLVALTWAMGCGSTCPSGFGLCSGECVQLQNDSGNCGACGVACAAGQVCSTGVCLVTCASGLTNCEGSCRDLKIDPAHCGDCAKACAADEVCSGGQCGIECVGGATNCDGVCANTATDSAHCGDCGTACTAGQVCNGSGHCELTCQPGLINCSGKCIDPLTDNIYCGASGNCQEDKQGTACLAGQVCGGQGQCQLSCQQGLVDCAGKCINPLTDNTYCGASGDCASANDGTQCLAGQVCNGQGQCQLSCQQGLVDCAGKCINPLTDNTYCGASGDCASDNDGTQCLAGQVCNGQGQCQLSCQQGLINCSGKCIDPLTNRTYCGASGNCTGPNGGTQCLAGQLCNGSGQCQLSCQQDLINCSGTCIDPLTDNTYCGASGDCLGANLGISCTAGQQCNGSGHCQLFCAPPTQDCGNGYCVDTATDVNNCGGCGNPCSVICTAGSCFPRTDTYWISLGELQNLDQWCSAVPDDAPYNGCDGADFGFDWPDSAPALPSAAVASVTIAFYEGIDCSGDTGVPTYDVKLNGTVVATINQNMNEGQCQCDPSPKTERVVTLTGAQAQLYLPGQVNSVRMTSDECDGLAVDPNWGGHYGYITVTIL